MKSAERSFRAAALSELLAWQFAHGRPYESPLRRERHAADFEISPDLRARLAAAHAEWEKAQAVLVTAREALLDEAEIEIGKRAPWWTFSDRRRSANSRAERVYEAVKSEWQATRDALWELVKHEYGF